MLVERKITGWYLSRMMNLTVVLVLLTAVLIFGCLKAETPPPQAVHRAIPQDARLVCLFFDDGWQNQYDVALPVLLKNNFKATFGIITGSIGVLVGGIGDSMSEKELKDLSARGMDIASHTRTHCHLTGNLTSAQVHEEIVGSKERLEKLGLKVRTFVYPYYEWDSNILNNVKKAGYTCARSGLQRPYDLTAFTDETRYHVDCNGISGQSLAEFKQIVSLAGRYSVVCLSYHYILDAGPAQTSTKVADYVEQMRYLREGGFTVMLLPELFE